MGANREAEGSKSRGRGEQVEKLCCILVHTKGEVDDSSSRGKPNERHRRASGEAEGGKSRGRGEAVERPRCTGE